MYSACGTDVTGGQGHKRTDCYGLNGGPQEHWTMSQPSEPQHVTLFGMKVFADVTKVKDLEVMPD